MGLSSGTGIERLGPFVAETLVAQHAVLRMLGDPAQKVFGVLRLAVLGMPDRHKPAIGRDAPQYGWVPYVFEPEASPSQTEVNHG